jgi:hypothetical protein
MDKENIAYIYNGVLFSHTNNINSFARKWMETGDHLVKHNKKDSEKEIAHVFSHMWNLNLKSEINAKGPVRELR